MIGAFLPAHLEEFKDTPAVLQNFLTSQGENDRPVEISTLCQVGLQYTIQSEVLSW
jgi:hypothetical protein